MFLICINVEERKQFFDSEWIAQTKKERNKSYPHLHAEMQRDVGGNSFNEFVLSYEYDLLGNITKVKDGSNNTLAQYTYDAQNQLLSETLPQQNKRYEYTYDTAGNVLSVKTFTATGTTATHTDTYTYGDSSWNDLLTGFNGQSITYDGSGNPLTYNNGTPWTFTWQKGRELASATSGSTSLSFTYDAEGIRDSKTVNGVTHKYTTVDGTIYCDKWGSNTLIFGYDENGRPHTINYNGANYYYVLNQQGDVIQIVNSSGAIKATYTYDAWGNLIASTGTTSGVGAVNPLLYRGYYYDAELGMYYLQSRYYDPVVKRFVNADGIDEFGNSGSFISLNLFAYCDNDPINLSDDTGRLGYEIVTSVLAGITSVIAYYFFRAITYYISHSFSLTNFKVTKKRIAWEFAGGVAGNLISISGLNKTSVAAISALTSGLKTGLEGAIKRKKSVTKILKDVVIDAIIAFALGYAGGSGVKASISPNLRISTSKTSSYFKVGKNSLKINRTTMKAFAKTLTGIIGANLISFVKNYIPVLKG